MTDISPQELYKRLKQAEEYPLRLLDVRDEIEFYTFNLGGTNIPLGKLSKELAEADFQENEEIVVLCQRGIRSATAKQLLETAGFKQVRNLTGGILAYQRLLATNNHD